MLGYLDFSNIYIKHTWIEYFLSSSIINQKRYEFLIVSKVILSMKRNKINTGKQVSV